MLGLIGALACSGDPSDPPDQVAGPEFRMDFSRPDFFSAPVPSVEGPDLALWPGIGEIPYTGWVRDIAARRPGAPRTAGVLLTAEALPDVDGLDVWRTMEADSPVYLVAVDGPAAGTRAPIDVWAFADAGPYGSTNLISVVPLQGWPLAADTTWALVVTTALTANGVPFAPSPTVADLAAGRPVSGLDDAAVEAYAAALTAVGVDAGELAALAVFRTGDPAAEFQRVVDAARNLALSPPAGFVLTDAFPTYCVWQGSLDWPVYQGGEPPFSISGGAWTFEAGEPVVQRWETGRIWVTVPRGAAPTAGWPVAELIRTGAGGDRPLVDRGVHAVAHGDSPPGSGPAEVFAAAGVAGVSFDGALGGDRNPTGADEQFLIFNFQNPEALRDNVRQSALEVALLPARLESAPALPIAGCDDAEPRFDTGQVALFGHSMGATIAPLALSAEPAFGAAVLSGAGGSYAANVLYKQLPLEPRPVAEAILGYTESGRDLVLGDPFLTLLQWAAEDADPPAYADRIETPAILMVQGIVDHYILPPIANTTSLSLGLDLAGPSLDAAEPELAGHRPLAPLLPLVGASEVALPAGPAVVVQVAADGIEDGHEVIFQVGEARRAYRCFLQSWAQGGAAQVPAAAPESEPCP